MLDDETIALFASTVIRYAQAGDWWQYTPVETGGGGYSGDALHIISSVHSHDVTGALGATNERLEPDANYLLRRHRDLREVLRLRARSIGEAVGMAPDLSYGEQCYAVWGLTRDAAVEIGRQFHQLAIFEIDDGVIRVVGCMGEGVVSERPFAIRFPDIRRCVMPDPFRWRWDETNQCSPPNVGDDPDDKRQRADLIQTWQRRYGLLGCDLCHGDLTALQVPPPADTEPDK